MASVLLIDGDRNFREALAIALRLDGCAVTSAATVRDGLKLLLSGGFDLCLLDLHLAGAEPLLATAAARSESLLLTGPYAELVEAAALRVPGTRALPKPFAAAELLACLPGGATSPPRWPPAPAG